MKFIGYLVILLFSLSADAAGFDDLPHFFQQQASFDQRTADEQLGQNMNNLRFLSKAGDGLNLKKHRVARFFDRMNEAEKAKNYVRPNERNPKKLLKILSQAPEGIYLSVGTERGFIGATMASNSNYLLLADAEEEVVLFNRINTALLKISKTGNIRDYKKLRFKASREDWIARAKEEPSLTEDERTLLANEQVHYFWAYTVRTFFFLKPYSAWSALPTFWQAHYMYVQKYFDKIQGMAKAGHIQSILLDWGNPTQLDHLVTFLKDFGTPLSVADFSNAWWSFGNRIQVLSHILERMAEVATDKSLFVISADKNIGFFLKQVWGYYAFKIKELADLGRRGLLDKVFNGQRDLEGFQVGEVQDLSKIKEMPANQDALKEKEKLSPPDPLDYFRAVQSEGEKARIFFDNNPGRPVKDFLVKEMSLVTPEVERQIVQIVRDEIQNELIKTKQNGKLRRDPPVFMEWFSFPLARRHPEIVEEMLNLSIFDSFLAENVLPQDWVKDHPQWVQSVIDRGQADSEITAHVLAVKWVSAHPEWIEFYLKKGTQDLWLSYFVFQRSWTRYHPEWIEDLIKNNYVDEGEINEILSKPIWKNNLELRRLAGHGLLMSNNPTYENLKAAFDRGETLRPMNPQCPDLLKGP